ncbi:MAG TPA: DMT family transporter [Anaeromyxobacteraceae bacterium]|nr:DMT family transporter [Anaeromyxobacteraceae bacterium]
MRKHDSATGSGSEALRPGAPPSGSGLVLGALGVLAFSFTLPATRLAVADLDGAVVGLGRAVVAAALAAVTLAVRGEPFPRRAHWPRLAVVSLGVVVGFPLFSALALRNVPASHGAVIVGLLPAATAVMAALRAGERPSLAFWISSFLGLLAVLAFAAALGAGRPQAADLLIFVAVLLGALGYAEGGALSRELGGWQVISWALVLSAPVLGPVVALRAAVHGLSASPAAWVGFAYVALVSQFLGFFAWYRGLALGGVARVGQLQLAQPVLTLLWSALLLRERVTGPTVVAAAAVLLSAGLTQRARVHAVAGAGSRRDAPGEGPGAPSRSAPGPAAPPCGCPPPATGPSWHG